MPSVTIDNKTLSFNRACIFSNRIEIYISEKDADFSSPKILNFHDGISQQLLAKLPGLHSYLDTNQPNPQIDFSHNLLTAIFIMKEPAIFNELDSYANFNTQNYGKYFQALTDQTNLEVLTSPPYLCDHKIMRRFDEVFDAIPQLSERVIEILTPEQRIVASKIIDEVQALLFIDTYEILTDYNLEKKVNLKLLKTYLDVIKLTKELFVSLNSSRDKEAQDRKLNEFRDSILFKLDNDWMAAKRLSNIKKALLKLIVKFSIWLAPESGLERGIDWSSKILRKKPQVLNYALNSMGLFQEKHDLISTLEITKKKLESKTYAASRATADIDLSQVSHKKRHT